MKLAKFAESDKAKKISLIIVQKGRQIGLVLYLLGIVVYSLFPAEGFHRKKFFDENALLTGLSKREFKDSALIADLQSNYRKHYKSATLLNEWICSTLSEYGLEVYTQNYSMSHMMRSHDLSNRTDGVNVYGILRAGRTPSVEAIVLTAPDVLDYEEESVGVAVVLALAKYFSGKNYWAKDIIFLITNGGLLGVQSWINAYTGTHSSVIHSSSLRGRSGSLQAVINIEIGRGNIRYINVIPEGVNAILPNLDLVFVASTLCETERIPIAYHIDWDIPEYFGLQPSSYYKSVLTSVAVLFHHVTGLPYTNHAPFLSHRIDSITLRAIHGNSSFDLQQLKHLARALEGIFRSINNLLEKLHHSEFFYINMSRSTFVSIGQYSSFFGFLLSPFLIESFRQWIMLKQDSKDGDKSKKISYNRTGIPPQFSVSLSPLFFAILSSLIGGCGLYFCPTFMHHFSIPVTQWNLFGCLLFVWMICVMISFIQRPTMTASTYNFTCSIVFLLITVVFYSLALMHFAFSLFLAIIIVLPLSLSTCNCLWSRLVLLVFSPPLLIFYYCVFYLLLFTNTEPYLSLITSSLHLLLSGVEKSYFFHHLSGAWLYPMFCLMLCPVWFLCWSLGVTLIKVDISTVEREHHPHLD